MSDWLHEPAALGARIPADFTMGIATSAYQVEGSLRADGRGEANWDVFSSQRGRILDGSDARLAADSYRRFADDLSLLVDLDVDAYRFSLAWPRLQPGGNGRANRAGVEYYDRVLDGLLAAGIRPMATLFHWDLPEELQHRGGWMVRDTALRFADYAYLAAEAFGDRVESWVTINEPATVTLNGYALGLHAPGATLLFDALPAAHHQLLGHGLAVEALRAGGATGRIGITNVHSPVEPASDSEEDALYATLFDLVHNRIYADPVLLGRYPDVPEPLQPLFTAFAEVTDDDLAAISAPLDFYGLNYYQPTRIAAGAPATSASPDGESDAMRSLPFSLVEWPEFARTGFGWPVAPSYLSVTLREMGERYGESLPPVVITESGASFADVVDENGEVDDAARTSYVADHLAAALDGAPGIRLTGFFVWSLLDNWEWAAGFTQRFGLVHLDLASQKRTPKRSYRWLREVLRNRA